eukprot:scaffold4400_cov124-Isochrysis_galbana.AAC.1
MAPRHQCPPPSPVHKSVGGCLAHHRQAVQLYPPADLYCTSLCLVPKAVVRMFLAARAHHRWEPALGEVWVRGGGLESLRDELERLLHVVWERQG